MVRVEFEGGVWTIEDDESMMFIFDDDEELRKDEVLGFVQRDHGMFVLEDVYTEKSIMSLIVRK